jgi:hypothetical protein
MLATYRKGDKLAKKLTGKGDKLAKKLIGKGEIIC